MSEAVRKRIRRGLERLGRETDEGREYVGLPCTLDGKPARIYGRQRNFALIVPDGEPHVQVEFSWQAVRNIMRSGGRFES